MIRHRQLLLDRTIHQRTKSGKIQWIIESANPKDVVASIVILYEVYKKIKKLKGEEEALLAVASLSQTTVVPIDQTIALEAADYSLELTSISQMPLSMLLHEIVKLNFTQVGTICGL